MCNNCGCGFEGNSCWWIILLIILFVVIFSCCGNNNNSCDNGCAANACGCGC